MYLTLIFLIIISLFESSAQASDQITNGHLKSVYSKIDHSNFKFKEKILEDALKEKNLEDALKVFLEEWEHRRSVRSEDTDLVLNQAKSNLNLKDFNELEDSQKSRFKTNCSRCMLQEEAKLRRLEAIKSDILTKLGLKQAPNITARTLPNIPPLHKVLENFEKYSSELSDSKDDLYSPSFVMDQFMSNDHSALELKDNDDYYVNTAKAMSFATKREYSTLLHAFFFSKLIFSA